MQFGLWTAKEADAGDIRVESLFFAEGRDGKSEGRIAWLIAYSILHCAVIIRIAFVLMRIVKMFFGVSWAGPSVSLTRTFLLIRKSVGYFVYCIVLMHPMASVIIATASYTFGGRLKVRRLVVDSSSQMRGV